MRCPLVLLLAATLSVSAQTEPDERAVHKLPESFAAAMTKHDGHELAQIMADDVDFVTVGAMWLHGRSDFETYHVRLLSGRFSEVAMMPLEIRVRFLHPDVAVLHWSWSIRGDKNIDGTKRQPRYGMMTMMAEKRDGAWLVVVAQNDNSDPGPAPESQGIKLPIPIPGSN
ncbi:MAG: SgcJ/EcaC family oxidoreductase [Bryobacteraceae bacterium]